jgi:hypothetical protein
MNADRRGVWRRRHRRAFIRGFIRPKARLMEAIIIKAELAELKPDS